MHPVIFSFDNASYEFGTIMFAKIDEGLVHLGAGRNIAAVRKGALREFGSL